MPQRPTYKRPHKRWVWRFCSVSGVRAQCQTAILFRVFEEFIRYNESALKHHLGQEGSESQERWDNACQLGDVSRAWCKPSRVLERAGACWQQERWGEPQEWGFLHRKDTITLGGGYRARLQRGSLSLENGGKITLKVGYLGRWGFPLH